MFKVGWGIFINITASVITDIEYDSLYEKIDNHLFVDCTEVPLLVNSHLEKNLLLNGVFAVKDKLPISTNLLLKIHKIECNPADYQDEGLYYAIAEWLSKYFNFDMPPYECYYDKQIHRYVFPNIVYQIPVAP